MTAIIDEEFEQERRDNIERLGNNQALCSASLDWIVRSMKDKYSYNFSWAGLPIIQFPQDVMQIQEIIWNVRSELIIETGGSRVFHASMLELVGGGGAVLGIDVDIRARNRRAIEAHSMSKRIRMLQGSSIDPEIIRKAQEMARAKQRVLVLLDSNHTHDHVLAELHAYSPLVTAGSYLIVLDTIVKHMPDDTFPDRPWARGNNPKTAVAEFLRGNDRFQIDAAINAKLQISVAPGGYLKCVKG